MPTNNIIGAGLANATVKLADASEYDIFAVVESAGERESDNVDVKGDDELKGTFVFAMRETLTIQANGVSFDMLQAITNNSLVSSPTYKEIALGTDTEKNPPYFELSTENVAKDSAGVSQTFIKTWHKCQVNSVSITQAQETELSISMTATAYQTTTDITGAALPSKRIATLRTENA